MRTKIKKVSVVDAAYLAGLIDGEGSIGIYYNGQSLVARLTIILTTPAPLKWAKNKLGVGQLRSYLPKNKKHRRVYHYVVLSKQAVEVIKLLLPFLKIKSAQAKNLLVFQVGLGKRYGVSGMPAKELKRRLRHAEISKFLNKRGR